MKTHLLLCLSLILILFGCTSKNQIIHTGLWSMYQGSPTHNSVFPTIGDGQWETKVNGYNNGGLALVDNVLYVNTLKGLTIAIDANYGKILWQHQSDNAVMTAPIVNKNVVIIGTGNNHMIYGSGQDSMYGVSSGDKVIGLDINSGKEVWSFKTVGEDMPTPALFKDLIIFANGDQHAYALDSQTGRLVWEQKLPGVSMMASAIVENDKVFIQVMRGRYHDSDKEDGHLLALDARAGKILWSAPYGNSDGSPTIGNNLIFTEGTETKPYGNSKNYGVAGINTIYGINKNNGNLVWHYESSIGYFSVIASAERAVAGTYADGTLFQSIPVTDELFAFDGQTGKVKWRFKSLAPIKMSPIITNGIVVFGDAAGNLYSVDEYKGILKYIIQFDKPFGPSPPIVAGAIIYFTNGETVCAYPISMFK